MHCEMMYTLSRYHYSTVLAMLHVEYEKRPHVPVLFTRSQLKRVSYARTYMRGICPGLRETGHKQQNARRVIPRDLYSNKLFV